jgi:hypothetical protein
MNDFVTGQQTPGTTGTHFNLLAFVFGQLLQDVQTASLVKVLSCTNSGGLSPVGRVSVQPLVFQVSGANVTTPHEAISDLPYMRLQGGSNAVILDPQPGDIGVAVFCSRDIANVKANPQAAVAAGGATPGSFGIFDWDSGLYLGGFLNGVPAQFVQFSAAGISITSPTKITLTAPTVEIDAATLFKVAAGAIDMDATFDATLAGATVELEATGAVTVSGGTIELAGPVSQSGGGSSSFSGPLAAQGTDVHTHTHGPGTYVAGSTPVTNDSGPPL